MPDTPSAAAPLTVFSTLAAQGAMPELARRFTARTGFPVAIRYEPTNALIERIRRGETVELAILTAEAVAELDGAGMAAARRDVAVSRVGIAVRAGSAKPDVSRVDALRTTLLGARSIVYSQIGASGVFFAGLIARLGIAEEVNAKAIIIPKGFTAELVARGEAELAVQQISELMIVPGVEIAGALPDELGGAGLFSACVFRGSPRLDAAAALLAFLASEDAAAVLAATGLDPVAGRPDTMRPT